MFERLFNRFIPNQAPDTYDESLFAFSLILSGIFALIILTFIFSFSVNNSGVYPSVTVMIALIGSLFLLRTGRLRLTMWLVLGIALVAHLSSMAIFSRLEDPGFHAVYILLIAATYFLGRRGMLIFGFTMLVWSIGMFLAEFYMLRQVSTVNSNPFENIFLIVLLLIMSLILLNSTLRRLKLTNEELRVAKDNAEVANQTKTAFLAMMGHELKTPLNSIIGYSDLLYEELEDYKDQALTADSLDTLHTDLKQIQKSGQSLLSIINDILEVSKAESNPDRIVEMQIDIDDLIDTAVDPIILRLKDQGNVLKVERPDSYPPFLADAEKLRVMLSNLIQNASKFTHDGEINVIVKVLLDPAKRPTELQLSVQDNGIGIEKNQQKRIFESFYQVDTSYSRNTEGSGLGLTICKRLADLMGGTLSLESEPGVGSTFTIRVPITPISEPTNGFFAR